MKRRRILKLLLVVPILLTTLQALSHHVLGRPAYSLNEDSNTPPSMNIETQIGDYFVTAMVFPAFPRPGEPGRINFYVTEIDTSIPLNSDVTFSVRNDSWLSSNVEKLGAQILDDNVYRQGFIFNQKGDYIITAAFEAKGVPYSIDFPMRVGEPATFGPLGITIILITLVLFYVNFVQKKEFMGEKMKLNKKEHPENFK